MEEKLYFKPETSGRKKKKEKPEKKDRRFLKLFFFLLFLVFVILVIIWLLKGSKTVSGQYPENIKNESLSCVSTTAAYERANYMTSDKRELKINAVFYGEEKLSSIGLIYTLEFESNEEAYSAEAINSTKFELALQQIGRSPASFNKKFTRMDSRLVLTLQTDANEIDDLTKDYFLISKEQSPNTLQEYRTNYESQGFACTSSVDKK